jgi:hypothetical protein
VFAPPPLELTFVQSAKLVDENISENIRTVRRVSFFIGFILPPITGLVKRGFLSL